MPKMSRDAAKLDDILNKTLGLLDNASELVARAGVKPPGEAVKMLSRASSEVLQAREALLESARTPAVPSGASLERKVASSQPVRKGWFGMRRRPRPRVLLGSSGDIARMALRLIVPWRLPHIEVGFAETLPLLEVQRAQHRITQRFDASQRLFLGPLLAATTVTVGAFNIVWKWGRDFNDLLMVLGAALVAWLAGNILQMAWGRFRLLLELLRLKRQVSKSRRSAR